MTQIKTEGKTTKTKQYTNKPHTPVNQSTNRHKTIKQTTQTKQHKQTRTQKKQLQHKETLNNTQTIYT